jgi:hypothetical protein
MAEKKIGLPKNVDQISITIWMAKIFLSHLIYTLSAFQWPKFGPKCEGENDYWKMLIGF